MYPAQYWRENKTWQKWLGQQGVVLACTTVHTSAPEFEMYTPYQLALVDFKKEKKLFMVPPSTSVDIGQRVEVVLRKGGQTTPNSVLEYQLKIVPVTNKS